MKKITFLCAFFALFLSCEKSDLSTCPEGFLLDRVTYYFGTDSTSLVFLYGLDGLPAESHFIKINGETMENEFYFHDSNGRLETKGVSPRPNLPSYQYLFKYRNGFLSSWTYWTTDGLGGGLDLLQTVVYQYENGKVKGFENRGRNAIIDYGIFTLDAGEKEVLVERFDARDSSLIERYVYEFGNVVNPLSSVEAQIEFYPDTKFLPIKKTVFDVQTLQPVLETTFQIETNSEGQAESMRIFQNGAETAFQRFLYRCN